MGRPKLELLLDRYPDGAYDPRKHQYGIIADYLKTYDKPVRKNDFVETSSKPTGLKAHGRTIKN